MPGRRDYGILRSGTLTEKRFRVLAARLKGDPELLAALAVVTARGLLPHLGIWAVRETDDGVLPDDGVQATHYATGISEDLAERLVRILLEPEVGVLHELPEGEGVLMLDFEDNYETLLQSRQGANRRAKAARERRNATRGGGPSGGRPARPGAPGSSPPNRPEGVDSSRDSEDSHGNGSRDAGSRDSEDSHGNHPPMSPESSRERFANRHGNDSRTENRIGENRIPPSPRDTAGGTAGGILPERHDDLADPRAPLPPDLAAVAAPAASTAPEASDRLHPDEWHAVFLSTLTTQGRGDALEQRPPTLRRAFDEQIESLRLAGASPAAVARALVQSPVSSLPSEVFRRLRSDLAAGRRP